MAVHRQLIPRLLIVLILVLLASIPAPAVQAAEDSSNAYVMGVFPFLPAANLEDIFAPVAAELSADINKTVKFRLSITYEAFVEALKEEAFDIVHIHPFDYVRYGRTRGYIPLVARSEELYAVFSVKSDSKITKINDLKGKRVGTPPATGAVTYLALDALHKAGVLSGKNVSIKNFPNHFACLQQLQIGNIDACATSLSTMRTFESQFGLKFRQIGNSESMPHTLFAVHKRVPKSDRNKMQSSLMGTPLSKVDPKLRELFISTSNPKTGSYFRVVTDKDYEPARKILQRLGIR